MTTLCPKHGLYHTRPLCPRCLEDEHARYELTLMAIAALVVEELDDGDVQNMIELARKAVYGESADA